MEGSGMRSEGTHSCISYCSPIASPDLSSCHRCGLRFPISDTIDRFRILDSQWRIVILCYDCLDGVKSAKVCSYCFLGIPESDEGLLGCIACSCRVHRACVPLHHRNLWHSQIDTDNFICVDCSPVRRFRGEVITKSGSGTRFRFLLEDLVGEAKSISEKVSAEGKERKNTFNKAMVARGSTEVTKTVPGAVHLVKELSHKNNVPDEELALRLHRSINGSQRFFRTFRLKEEKRLNVLRKV
ncbi:uncharacterized protein LOC110020041 isoform X1 [Phalaenopsis equestris]|uniref:uncharacterized protein LOC110020041 isoform X1 n=1 Tax=Phalaenopsis equestris TaxID=78828 RepID=UPI0009E37FD5|nr:uncharacterized protein LOC110020041 isoform X1 [Phalaenopsis equestris]XP_020573658.1 uncharacterized protein LOC110020041 isoform X1 [Phalaenopsis equestris]XP_020573659.1 uncharacterized protein LOC110020041 isoform X1 [Phalaenopsis equestris]XP_020573660.1 uncharacterized protein LOC110020041 isoform X1 [Phalaenopsis equestris]XP_020573661.1 uncharacterized protein LOC110020041 isoform X1 [Phalaenopsis equestris]XP_020573662.1 uncharacterized protein LOC110020041 isoform X1 [Phalaenopsi